MDFRRRYRGEQAMLVADDTGGGQHRLGEDHDQLETFDRSRSTDLFMFHIAMMLNVDNTSKPYLDLMVIIYRWDINRALTQITLTNIYIA